MAKIKELVEKGIIKEDHWLNLATKESEDVDIIDNTVVWINGYWKRGIWKDGIWKDGIWKDGVWEGGSWEDGAWEGGFWEGGTWEGGLWKGGIWKQGTWKVYINETKNSVKIGCKEKKVDEWDEWFASDKEYETKRGTDSFKNIEESYKIARFAIKLKKIV